MKEISLFLIFLCVSAIGFAQFYTPAQLHTITTQKTAGEGDMYLDTVNGNYFIGLTTGELSKIGYLDSITFQGDTLRIHEGDSLFSVFIPSSKSIINGLDNSTVYFINSTSGGSSGGSLATDTGCPPGEIRLKRMIEGVCDIGFQGQAFIGCDDNIWICGDAGTQASKSPFGHTGTSQDAASLFAAPQNPEDTRKGKWKYLWATRGVLWALTDSGEVFRMGGANSGQLGNNSLSVNLDVLTKLTFFDGIPDKVTYLYTGSGNQSNVFYSTVFALTEGGDVYSWGENQYGQIGNGTTTDALIPSKITALDAPFIVKMSVADSRFSTCFAIDDDNNLYSWGYQRSGGLGNGTASGNVSTPALIPGIKASEVKGVGYFPMTRIITTDSSTMATGENGDRQIGNNTNTDQTTFTDIFYNPTNEILRNNVAEIDVWSNSIRGGSLIVTYDRELWVCGGNLDLQQGIGTDDDDQPLFQKPVADFQGMVRKAIFTGSDNGEVSITVLDTLGRIWTCGDNFRGQIARGNLDEDEIGLFRLAITSGNTQGAFVDIKSFGRTSVVGFAALTYDGKVLVTGSNSNAQAGVGIYPAANVNYLRPITFE